MKIILSLIFILFSAEAKSQADFIDSVITKESLELSVSALAHDSMKGRFTAFPQTKKAAEFIAKRFEAAGLKPMSAGDGFFDYYPLIFEKAGNLTTVEGINVVGAIQGSENVDALVIFCAHYDHIGQKIIVPNKQKDSIYNGANDNASGVALLIELAKYYAASKINRYTLVFIAFSGEEQGLLGSASLAKSMDQSRVHAVINFDMVGRPVDNWTKNCMVIAQNSKPIINSLNAEVISKKPFFVNDKYPEQMLFSRSDHYSFGGVKTRIFFTASSATDQYYHTLEDEFKTIDFDFLLTTTKNIGTACKIFIK